MPGTLVMKSGDKWYAYNILYKGYPSQVTPILDAFWTTQRCIETILDTCGLGIKMVFLNRNSNSEGRFSMAGWYDGDNFDHSPEWSNSPDHPTRSKMVAVDYYSGPHKRPLKSFDSEADAIASTSQPHIYVWNGENWQYTKKSSLPTRRKNHWGR